MLQRKKITAPPDEWRNIPFFPHDANMATFEIKRTYVHPLIIIKAVLLKIFVEINYLLTYFLLCSVANRKRFIAYIVTFCQSGKVCYCLW